MLKSEIRLSEMLTEEAFENAIMADMALGGSTNTVLHLPAIARELGIGLSLEIFDEISRKVPHLCGIAPGENTRFLSSTMQEEFLRCLKGLKDL